MVIILNMALYRITNTLHRTTSLPKDDVVNVFHFETPEGAHSPVTASELCGHVAASYQADSADGFSMSEFFSTEIDRATLPHVRAYNPLGGSPLAEERWAGFPVPAIAGGANLPAEVALCLSFKADLTDIPEESADDADADSRPERPAARRRGRVYLGPFGAGYSTAPGLSRPNDNLRRAALAMAVHLAAPAPAVTSGATWVIRSDSGFAGDAYPVETAWVDDAWDTQRRRGAAASNRMTQVL